MITNYGAEDTNVSLTKIGGDAEVDCHVVEVD